MLYQRPINAALGSIGLKRATTLHYQLSVTELISQTLTRRMGMLTVDGALAVSTGEFTGRSPQDRFIVYDSNTIETIHWNNINQPLSSLHFDRLHHKILRYLEEKEVWMRDATACADPDSRLHIRFITEYPWADLFCHNMFREPEHISLDYPQYDWLVLHAPGCMANPDLDGTRQHNFVVLNFSKRILLIGGTAYTGEIKKGIFSILNYLLPRHGVLSMHCAANKGKKGDTALFFGLSGTGKTTLSADPDRSLIGDDEHGWSPQGIFNLEGGCYAKCIHLHPDKEPMIYKAIRAGSLLENVQFYPGSNEVNFADDSITENTRVSYPLEYIDHVTDNLTSSPKHIFFLTCDAYGILPPVARLTSLQAMYYFLSGYTAKIAGTESGIKEPKATFSACFGAPFLPLHPVTYASMLGEKIKQHNVQCWLVNTGWTGGSYGTGERIPLSYTRTMIHAVLENKLDEIPFETYPIFKLSVPSSCSNVPLSMLHPRNTWKDSTGYDVKARELAFAFQKNFKKYAGEVDPEIINAGPQVR